MSSRVLKSKADLLKLLDRYDDDTRIRVMATDSAKPMDLGDYMVETSPDQPITLTLILLDEEGLPILEEAGEEEEGDE